MKKITAKFSSKCFETGKPLIKGTQIYYDVASKKAYHLESKTVKSWEANKEENQETRDTSALIEAQENAYWENFAGR